MKHCDPPQEEWHNLRPKLTEGELEMGELLLKNLSDPWELYLQPPLNGLVPDFVLLNPHRGVVIIEVKDWSAKKPHPRKIESAQNQLETYLDEMRRVYAPSLESGWHRNKVKGFLALPFQKKELTRLTESGDLTKTLPEALHFWNQEDLKNFRSNRVSLSEALTKGMPKNSKHMAEAYQDLRHWLIEPEFKKQQRRPLPLDGSQRNLVQTRTVSGRRRIRGPAGSGKSLIIAARASQLARAGKTVLVVTYNITLLNYLKDLAVRWPKPSYSSTPIRKNITWMHFHGWCRRVCFEAGYKGAYRDLWKNNFDHKQDVLDEYLANLTAEILKKTNHSLYDVILVDEAQDFPVPWINCLEEALPNKGEMLLAADISQDIYGRTEGWNQTSMGRWGPWTNLKHSYRLPLDLIHKMRAFMTQYIPEMKGSLPYPKQTNFNLSPTDLVWKQVSGEQSVSKIIVKYLLNQLKGMKKLGISELVLVTSSNKVGIEAVDELEKRGIKVLHTFTSSQNSKHDKPHQSARVAKIRFFKGASKVKATTIHSFKGFESRAVLVHLGPKVDANTAYIGLTRVKASDQGSMLTVVCESKKFSRTWNTKKAATKRPKK